MKAKTVVLQNKEEKSALYPSTSRSLQRTNITLAGNVLHGKVRELTKNIQKPNSQNFDLAQSIDLSDYEIQNKQRLDDKPRIGFGDARYQEEEKFDEITTQKYPPN